MKTLDQLRQEMELTHCPDCRAPYQLLACNARHLRIQQDRLRVRPNISISVNAVVNSIKKSNEQSRLN